MLSTSQEDSVRVLHVDDDQDHLVISKRHLEARTHTKQFKILVAIVESNLEKVVEQYETDIGDLDPFVLKKLLQNICERIITNYRRDLLFGYPRKQNIEPDPLREVLTL